MTAKEKEILEFWKKRGATKMVAVRNKYHTVFLNIDDGYNYDNIPLCSLAKAEEEIGKEEFWKHFCYKFDKYFLDYVDTIIINLSGPCYCGCEYCIDKKAKQSTIEPSKFIDICEKTFKEFPKANKIAITGGTMDASNFEKLLNLVRDYYPKEFVCWNTNGVKLDDNYKNAISKIDAINLHRFSIDDKENEKHFKSKEKILSLKDAKELFGDRLFLRAVVDDELDLDSFLETKLPLNLNQLLPKTESSVKKLAKVVKKMENKEIIKARRNRYINGTYNGVKMRVSYGDQKANHISGRPPVFVNVAIILRTGNVCGTWFEDDKVLMGNKDV